MMMKANVAVIIKVIIREVAMVVLALTGVEEAIKGVSIKKEVEAEVLVAISTMATIETVVVVTGENLATTKVLNHTEDEEDTREEVDHEKVFHQVATQHHTHLSQAVVRIPSTKVVKSTTTSPTLSTRSRVEPTESEGKCLLSKLERQIVCT